MSARAHFLSRELALMRAKFRCELTTVDSYVAVLQAIETDLRRLRLIGVDAYVMGDLIPANDDRGRYPSALPWAHLWSEAPL